MSVSDEIVEKSAAAQYGEDYGDGWANATDWKRHVYMEQARAGLEAVYGDIRKQVAEEIAQALEAHPSDPEAYIEGWRDVAARIARHKGGS